MSEKFNITHTVWGCGDFLDGLLIGKYGKVDFSAYSKAEKEKWKMAVAMAKKTTVKAVPNFPKRMITLEMETK